MKDKMVNGYTLIKKLGHGGMGEVWLAQNKIGKQAAVKLLLDEYCKSEQIVSRFENEARLMAKLEHPNIRKVYDYETDDNKPYILMEYLSGNDMNQRVERKEKFSPEQIREWWNQAVKALNYTHKQGVIHRDIKPSNLFVCDDGKLKLMDFGIAKGNGDQKLTQTGMRMGTLLYMSPEQITDSKRVNYKTDVYSLAITFFYLITGKAPYDLKTDSEYEMLKHIVEAPVDLSSLSPEWRNFLAPYLEKEPDMRPDLKPFGQENDTRILEPLATKTDDPTSTPDDGNNKLQKNIKYTLIGCFVIAILLFAFFVIQNTDTDSSLVETETETVVPPTENKIITPPPAEKKDVNFYRNKIERYYTDIEIDNYEYVYELFAPQINRLYNIKTTIGRNRVVEEGIKYSKHYPIRRYEIVDISIVESTDERTVVNLTNNYIVRQSEDHPKKTGTTREVIVFDKNDQVIEMYNNNTK